MKILLDIAVPKVKVYIHSGWFFLSINKITGFLNHISWFWKNQAFSDVSGQSPPEAVGQVDLWK